MNPAGEAILGWTREELLGNKMHDMTHYKHPDGSPFPASECPGLQVLQKGLALREREDVFIHKDGRFVPVIFSASPLVENGETTGVIVGFRDDTEQRQSRESLLQAMRELGRAKDHLQLLTEAMAASATRCSRDFRYLWASQSYADWLERPLAEIIGKPIAAVLGQEAFDNLRPHFEAVLSGQKVSYELEVNFHGVGRRWISATYTPTFDSDGSADGWVAVVWDITERKRAEEARSASEERFRTASGQLRRFLDTAATGLVRYDRDLRYLEANAAYTEMVGLDVDQIIGLRVPDVVGPRGWAKIRSYVQRVLGGERVEFESTIHYARTGSRQLHVVYTPERDDANQVTGWVASITNISEHRRAERALRESEAQLAAETRAIKKLNDLASRLWRIRDLRQGLDEMLAGVIELLGADRGNIQLYDAHKGVLVIAAQHGFDPEFLDFFREVSAEDPSACGRALRSGQCVAIVDVEADAPFAPFREVARKAGYRAVISVPLAANGDAPLGVMSAHFRSVHRPSDADQRRLALYARQAANFIQRCKLESELRQRTSDLETLLDSVPALVWIAHDSECNLITGNRATTRLYGIPEGSNLSLNSVRNDLLARCFDPEGRELKADELPMQRSALAGRRIDDVEIRVLMPDGRNIWMRGNSTPLFTEDSRVRGVISCFTDVTERKAMEDRLRLHREQLERQVEQRTSELSEANRQLSLLTTRLLQLQDHERRRLARELHDSAGQLLTALGMNLYRLRRSGQLNEENERILSDADTLLENAAAEIRTISHLLHPPLLDEKGLSSALQSYVQGFEERSGIETRLELPEAGLERLHAELELAIYRIVQEALTNVHRHSGSATATVRLVRSSDEVRLEVSDRGRGIPLDQRATLATDESKGVGLRAIRERVAQLRGTLELRTDQSGTTISLKLPVAGAVLAVSSK
jgi:PAS domain S-box-containing protein